MTPDATPTSDSQADSLNAASNDADENAGTGDVGAPVSSCQEDNPLDSLWVRLDLSLDDAQNEQGSLHLVGATRGYDQTIAIASNFSANPAPDNTVDVHFESVPIKDSYSLKYLGSDGAETLIIESVAFSSLNDNSLPAAQEEKETPDPAPEEQ